MSMQLQASKAALCASVLLLAVLLALLSGAALALWGNRATTTIEPGSHQPCSVRRVWPVNAGQTPELEHPPLHSSQIQQDLTYLGETPC
jgi:hypothetical protein